MHNDGEAAPPGAGQGVQYGSHNVQFNAWPAETPFDPVSLSALSTPKAVARLLRASRDDIAAVFGKSSPNDMAEILKDLLREDESKAIAALAELNQRKARDLIETVEPEFPWLADLPEAAHEITTRAKALELGDEIGELTRVPVSLAGRNGYSRAHKKGIIYWDAGNAYAVSEEIADYYTNVDGPCGAFGFPTGNATRVKSSGGARGTMQNFQAGTIYSSDNGTHSVSGKIDTAYQAVGGAAGWLGFPVSGQQQDGPDERGRYVDVQHFDGGLIYLSAMGTFPVRSKVAQHTKGWFPETQETRTKRSPVSGILGKGQGFWRPPRVRMTVYFGDDTGTYGVGQEILEYYEGMKGPASALGFPISAVSVIQRKGWYQEFEGGRIYVRSGTRTPVTVPAPTVQLLVKDAVLAERIGWPVSEEEPVGKQIPHGQNQCMQRFEHGIVTGQGKSREIWVRPPIRRPLSHEDT